MKKIALIFALIIICSNIFAQDKKFANIQKLYELANYDECIEACNKYKQSNPQNIEVYYYIAFCNYQKYASSKKEFDLRKTESTLLTAVRKNKYGQVPQTFAREFQVLKDSLLDLQDRLFNNDQEAKASEHAKMYASIYQDTTEVYKRCFMPELFRKEIPQGKQLAEYQGETNKTDISGYKQGVWIERYPNGNRKSQINFVNNKPLGEYYKFYESGGLKAQMYFETQDKVATILYHENGDKYAMGYYFKHKQDSIWQYFDYDSILITQVQYKEGIKNGKEIVYHMTGAVCEEIIWKNGKKDGIWKRFYSDGKPMFETNLKDGVQQGSYVKYDTDGRKIIFGNYKDDLKNGIWNVWDSL